MATRMQQRRGTAAQWTGSDPVLEAGEMGWESDTNKFKIGDGTNDWSDLQYFNDVQDLAGALTGTYLELSDIGNASGPAGLDASKNLLVPGESIIIEGLTNNEFETTITVVDPTADRTITIPNVTGTVITTGNLSDITNIGVFSSTIVMEGTTDDSSELTLSAGDPTADRTLTFPDATDTLVGKATTDPLTNKSISLGSNTVTSTLAQLNTAVSDADVASLAGSETLTNKTIAIGSNTVSGTIAQFNTAVTDADFATLAGSETLTNKTIAIGSNTVSGTIAQFNTAVTDADFATLAGTETFTNKTLTSPAINTPTGITKSDVGLANVDNTTDANKPISTATQSALDLKAPLASPTFTGTVSAATLTLSGDLTVNGTTTTINSTTLSVDDKNVVLGDVATPSDATADGGGLTLKGATDKTLNWVDATDAWTSSEHVNLASGKSLYLNGTLLKDVTETLTNKTLTSPTINTATVTTPSAASIPLITKGAASQTASLQEWQNSADTVLAKVTTTGVVSTGAGVYSPYYQGNNGVGGTIAFANATAITITPQSASVQPLILKGAASQTANLQEWQNSAGTVLTSVDKDGHLQTPRLTITNGGNIVDSAGTTPYFGFGDNQITIYARNAAYKPLIIQGAASQTANLQEWQNSSGSVLSFIRSDGFARLDAGLQFGTMYSHAGKWQVDGGNSFKITGSDAAVQPLIVKGAASQTANLQEWQNSAGTVLAKVTPTGDITAPSATLNGSTSGTTQILSGAVAGTSVLTLPVATDTLVGRATTDTLTNKTLTSPALTTPTISTYTTAGDLVYGGGSGVITRLAAGTSGYVLTSGGASTAPSWAAAASDPNPNIFMLMGA